MRRILFIFDLRIPINKTTAMLQIDAAVKLDPSKSSDSQMIAGIYDKLRGANE